MDSFFIFGKDVFPDSWEIYGFYDEQIATEPANDLHFAISSIIEELEDLKLIFKEMENNRKVNLPFTDPAISQYNSPTNNMTLIYDFTSNFIIFMRYWIRRDQSLKGSWTNVI